MKQWYFHLIYLSIIAFLGYNYWSSVQAFKAFEHLNTQLNADYEIMNEATSSIFKNINKSAQAYQNFENRRNNEQSKIAIEAALSLNNFIDSNKRELIKGNSFTYVEIKEITNKLLQFSNSLVDSVNDKMDKEELSKVCYLPKLIADNAYWESIKTLPKSGIIAELSCIQNKLKIDEITFLNYYYSKTNGTTIEEDYYRTAIAPKKAVLIEGETFEADIFLAKYASSPGRNLIIKVNGEPLKIKDGVAHFKNKNQTIGTKTIKAEAIIRNPLTGQTMTTLGSFEYQVLPKCSRDCQ
jgi:hypothetical protein